MGCRFRIHFQSPLVRIHFQVAPLNIGGKSLFFNAPISIAPVDNVYKVNLAQRERNNWYISLSGSTNETASANIVSGSYITGSLAHVLFEFEDFERR
jgi:hypothetical protein